MYSSVIVKFRAFAVSYWHFGITCRCLEGLCPEPRSHSHQLHFLTSHYDVTLGYAAVEARNLSRVLCDPLPYLNLAGFRHPISYDTSFCPLVGLSQWSLQSDTFLSESDQQLKDYEYTPFPNPCRFWRNVDSVPKRPRLHLCARPTWVS